MLVDTHCHLNFEWFDQDRAAVLQRAWDAGVTRILIPGIEVTSSRQAIALAESHPEIFAAVGVHPNDALAWNETTLDELRHLAKHPRVKAIGEIGLDYYRDRAPRELQRQIFEAQLSLAAEVSLPVVIHTRSASPEDRQATADVLAILREWKAGLEEQGCELRWRPGVLHSFSDDIATAQDAAGQGFYIGITGPVTFRKADELREVVASLPLISLLIETDAPFLTPHPHRGERNEPAFVRFVAEKIAQIHHLTYEAVGQTVSANAARLFQW